MLTRRDFIKVGVATTGVAITIHYLPFLNLFKQQKSNIDRLGSFENKSWSGGPGLAKHRYEGVAKVTGAKIYARDFRASDFSDWPHDEVRVALIKSTCADKVFLGVNTDIFPKGARPFKVVSAEDLESAAVQCPRFFGGENLLVKKGASANYLGQGLAILYFQPEAFLQAIPFLNNPDPLIQYGGPAKAASRAPYLEQKFVKYKQGNEILFSAAKDGTFDLKQASAAPGSREEKMQTYSKRINEELEAGDWHVFTQTYKTQSVDTGFMEPENGLGWYDRNQETLHLVTGSQSPYNDAEHAALTFSGKGSKIPVKSVEITACYPGGGFGGKDHSLFAVYLALAAGFADGKPVRMVNSRFDQFQFGLKRHAAEMKETLAIDKNGKFQALKAEFSFDGGGNDNFSWCVPVVAADNSGSGSYFPKVEIAYRATPSIAVPAGSMRGFGASQAQFALESLIDEAAGHLQTDAIDLRLKNALGPTQETVRGIIPNDKLQISTLLEKARSHPLWVTREKVKMNAHPGKLAGVGFAMAMKSFGTTRDASLAEVSIEKDGTISLVTNYLDMGNGVATTLPVTCAKYLGSNATRIRLGAVDEFNRLNLFSEFCTEQAQLDRLSKNPRFSPEIMMAAAASAGAYQHRQVVMQAARLVFQYGVIPTAKKLWGNFNLDITQVRWENTQLMYPGLPPLDFSKIAEGIHKQKNVNAVMVHGYYQAGWAKAEFDLGGGKVTLPIDALAVKRSGPDYQVLDRISAEFPPVSTALGGEDVFTPCGALCRVLIDRKTGQVEVKEMHTFLDCGPTTNQQIVEGQVNGAVAMGIGQALFEHFPQYEEGPGTGGWNFHRYYVARAKDVPILTQEVHLIAPLSPDDEPKGMAEAVLNPIAPSVANAVAHATGKRFRELPILPAKIKEALS